MAHVSRLSSTAQTSHDRGVRGGWAARAVVLGVGAAALGLLGCRTSGPRTDGAAPVLVVRVQNPSDDRSGAEHCPEGGAACRPLAPGQEIPRSGIVRTFAGSGVTLDLGQGQKLDLGPLSEAELRAQSAELTRGEVGISGSPLIAKEPASTFDFVVGRRTFQLDRARGALAHFAVGDDGANVTLRQGQLRGPDVDRLTAGDTIRLTQAGAFRTSALGGELGPLPYVGSRRRDFGELWPETASGVPCGLGTMTARLPNTDQVLGGVRLAKHQVTVTIVDGIARTEVVEEFENETEQIVEGRFRFPVPGDAAVSRLGLWVGEQLVEGEVVEAERARRIYESIVDRPVPRDPALLEWVTAGEMSLKVFPILGKSRRRVLLAYDQVLTMQGGRFRYAYPLSLGEGRTNTIGDLSIAVHVRSTRGDVERVSVPSHDARIGREGAWTSAYFSQANVAAARDFVVVGESGGGAFVAVDAHGASEAARPPGSDVPPSAAAPASRFGHFVLRASVDLPAGVARPSSIRADRAIVLDVSYGQSTETVRAQSALALAIISELESEEGFVLLACDSACAVLASPAGPILERKQKALAFLTTLRPGGASDIAGALVAGSLELGRLTMGGAGRGRQLVLLSDGQPSAGELTAASIARVASQHLTPQHVDLRLIGVGRKLDHGQLENLAIELDAALDFLPAAAALEQHMFEISIGLRQPVVRDAHITLPAGLSSARGSRLPALRLGQEVVLTGELLGAEPSVLHISGRLEGNDYRLTVPLDLSLSRAQRNPFVSGLFARDRIQALLADDPEFHRTEIVRLSTTYRTMSPYASFLVLENDEMFRRFGVERRSRQGEGVTQQTRDAGPQSTFAETSPLPESAESKEVERSEAFEPERAMAEGQPAGPAPASAPAPSSAPKASAPSSAPTAKKKSSASSGGGSRHARDSWDPMDPLSGRLDDLPGAYVYKRPAPPRAHLSFSVADDAWRTWASDELALTRDRLDQAPESRARMEDFIRRHLAQGRFPAALEVARRFVDLDPDHRLAQSLMADAAVVSGDHELSRRMLDAQVETSPRSVELHQQAGHAFANAGDGVRACAHFRSVAELSPSEFSAARARSCWSALLGGGSPPASSLTPTEEYPQLRVEVTCDVGTAPSDCPAPIVVGPDGRVVSPWTPGMSASSRASVSLPRVRSGAYFVLVLGGAPGVRGRIALSGRQERTNIAFTAGGLRTVARTDVAFY